MMMKSLLKGLARRTGLRREQVAAVRMRLERQTLAFRPPASPRPGGRILCYHSIGQPEMGVNDVSPGLFREHIETALEAGFRFIAPAEAAETGGGPKDLAITFDDALSSTRTQAEPILREYAIPWTLFAVTDWCERDHPWGADVALHWGDIEWLAGRGVEVGNHSTTHADFAKISEEEMEDELAGSQRVFENRLGFAPSAFAIPFGQSGNWPARAMQMAQNVGFKLIYAQAEATRPPDTTARTFVTRFDTKRIFLALLAGAFDHWEEWI